MKFSKDILRSIVYGYPEGDVTEDLLDFFEKVEETLVDTTRWSLLYELVFKFSGKYYKTSYSVGATECQDESPFEYDPDMIECAEVEPVEVTVVQYREVK